MKSIDQLRARLDEVDGELVSLMAERQRIVGEIGKLKRSIGQQTRDFAREKQVLDHVRERAAAVNLEPDLASTVLESLIEYSLRRQEQARLSSDARGAGGRALVIGGAGRLGRWFVGFLASQGYAVSIADPAADPHQDGQYLQWQDAGTDFDVIVIAATLQSSADILDELIDATPQGLVFDVGSLKSPLRESLARAAHAGIKVTSLHPMFGPSTQLLAGKHIIFVDVGCREATAEARALFGATMAECVDMDLDAHDRLIAAVLGLSHVTNIAFMEALRHCDAPAEQLLAISSTTFDAQVAISGNVVNENPKLYFEIQRLNEFGGQSVAALKRSIDRISRLIEQDDLAEFDRLMRAARTYLATSSAKDEAAPR
ncbi:MAG: prephenate dehydrogenase/arogenate dehydrogenase family protein [Pseudomonadota bacterium]